MKRYVAATSLVFVIAAGLIGCSKTEPTVITEKNTAGYLIATTDDNLAVKGYDVVGYFNESRAVEGSTEHSTQWHGVQWRFASEENLEAFTNDPEKYAPEYGGYCAWGVAAQNDLFEIDPEAWKIVDGKLYLNYDKDVQKKWLGDIDGFVKKGDENWPELVNKGGAQVAN